MGARKLVVGALRLALLALAALLASGCVSMSSQSSSLAPGQTPSSWVTATVSAQAAPALGSMSYGKFPATTDGTSALNVCEHWAQLRDEYVGQLRADTLYQLEAWFSSPVWLPAFESDSPLRTDPDYSQINTAFTLVSTAAAASLGNARLLDNACASAD